MSDEPTVLSVDLIDCRELLKKYIDHVHAREGVSFLDEHDRRISGTRFTDAEWAMLLRLEDEDFRA